MVNLIILKVENDSIGKRLDVFISSDNISRSASQILIEDGKVLVNGKQQSKNYKMRINDIIEIQPQVPVEYDAVPEDIPIDIVYEDKHLIVVNKPKNMVVHPAAGNLSGTLVNGILYHCKGSLSSINGVIRPGIVHRIDKDTSGLLVVAKDDKTHIGLSEQLSVHSMNRVYHAVVYGNLKQDTGTIDAPIGRHPVDRKKMHVTDKNSRHAITHYTVIERFSGFTYVELKLETGRTHQIRVHMSYVGHPIAGDQVYATSKVINYLGGQCLHAKILGFVHPITDEYLTFESELPSYFTDFLRKIKKG